jgi:hypothetical protein
MPLTKVKPGDLITAEFINQIIDEINRLDKKVAALRRKKTSKVAKKRPAQRKSGRRF